jgi:hypothetical protein
MVGKRFSAKRRRQSPARRQGGPGGRLLALSGQVW